ncbi:MAG: DUF4397 domain-containing protein [Chloroflexota bacterium]|jgi:hypothetical protein
MKRAIVAITLLTLGATLPGAVAADEPEAMADVRVLHAAGGASAVDIFASGAQLGGPLDYGQITDYIEVPAGVYQVQVVPSGSTPAAGSSVIDTQLELAPETMTTVVASGSLDAGIVPVVLLDAPEPGDAISQIRFSHFVFYAPPVDIAADGAEVIVPDLAFAQSAGYLDLPEGEYDLELRLAGTSDVVFDADPVTLDDQTSLSVFVIGNVADGSFSIVSAVDASPDLRTQIEEGLEDLEEEIEELFEDDE